MHNTENPLIEGVVFRWKRVHPVAVMHDTRAVMITAAVMPIVACLHWADQAPALVPASVSQILSWAVSALVMTLLLYRTQMFFRTDLPQVATVCAVVNACLTFTLLWGTPVWENVQFSLGAYYLSTFLFVGGDHPVDRYINAGWAAFVITLFVMLMGNAP